jgi:hypothetical protein
MSEPNPKPQIPNAACSPYSLAIFFVDSPLTMSPSFTENIRKAIAILAELDGQSKDPTVLQAFEGGGIAEGDAKLILIILPIAFCRRLLPAVNWIDDYNELVKQGQPAIKRKFSQTAAYLKAWEEANTCFQNHPGRETILKIAGRSAEFHAINELLSRGGKLEEIQMVPMTIVW